MRAKVLVLILFMLLATSSAWPGTCYVNFDDGLPGPLVEGKWLGTAGGDIAFHDYQAWMVGRDGYLELQGPFSGDFSIEATFTNSQAIVDQVSQYLIGILIDRPGGTLTDGIRYGTTRLTPSVLGWPEIPNHTNMIVVSPWAIQFGPGEVLPSDHPYRMSLRVVKTGATIGLYAAYGSGATTPTRRGSFHEVPPGPIPGWPAGDVIRLMVGMLRNGLNPVPAGIPFDDVIIEGDGVADYNASSVPPEAPPVSTTNYGGVVFLVALFVVAGAMLVFQGRLSLRHAS